MRRGHAFPESRRSKSTEDLMTARILLVEDDPTTCAFLAAAARGVPAEVDVAGSCAAALALAGDRDRHDLWLIDETGRAHVGTPATNVAIVRRCLLDKKKTIESETLMDPIIDK